MEELNDFHRNALVALAAARAAVDAGTRREWLGIADNWIALFEAYAAVHGTQPADRQEISTKNADVRMQIAQERDHNG